MKLDSVDRVFFVPESHNFPLSRICTHFETVWERFATHEK